MKERLFDFLGDNTIIIYCNEGLKITMIDPDLYNELYTILYSDYYFEMIEPSSITLCINKSMLKSSSDLKKLTDKFYSICNNYQSINKITIDSDVVICIDEDRISNPSRIISLVCRGNELPLNIAHLNLFDNVTTIEIDTDLNSDGGIMLFLDSLTSSGSNIDTLRLVNKYTDYSTMIQMIVDSQSCKNITDLTIRCVSVALLNNLKHMTNLRRLKIICYELENIPHELLSSLTKLEYLDISETHIDMDTYKLCIEINEKYGIPEVRVPSMLVD